MAVLETRCPHCHRQSQFKSIDRISEGPYSYKVAPHTQWGYAFHDAEITRANLERKAFEKRKDELNKQALEATSVTDKLSKLAEAQKLVRIDNERHLAAFSAKCTFADCGGPVLLFITLESNIDRLMRPEDDNWKSIQLPVREGGPVELLAVFPSSSGVSVHESWPQIAKTHLPELVEDLVRKRDSSRILSGARTVLDVVLKDLLGDDLPSGRAAQIRKLQENGIITSGIADWAKSLWKDGSDASHDGIGDQQQAAAYVDFLKVFLHVAYALPTEIRLLKAKTDLR